MNAFPVIKRELRAQAQQSLTHWLRAGAVAVMLVAAVIFGINSDFKPGAGAALLTSLQASLFIGIWVFVPAMTADCLSRERREGTLGLLFLTNLKPLDIVLAKATAHALRAFTFWAATLPALMLPFLIGGAGWQHAVSSVLFDFMALCLALGAGVLASSHSKTWARAVVSALLISTFFWFALSQVNLLITGAVTLSYIPGFPAGSWREFLRRDAMAAGITLPFGGLGWLGQLSRYPRAQAAWLRFEGVVALVSLLFLWLCLWLASRGVAKQWREEPPSALTLWMQRTFCTPVVAVGFLNRWMRRTLSSNPVGWLEVRSWSARVMTWSWFGLIVLSFSYALTNSYPFGVRSVVPPQFLIGWLLAGTIAFNAAGSFRRERESGVLELLLVSPLSVAEIVNGRLLGIWGQFLPATSLFVAISYSLASLTPAYQQNVATWFFAVTFLTLPVVGLYFSLARSQFMNALVWTLGIGLFLPLVLGPVGHWLLTPAVFNWGRTSVLTEAAPYQVVIAVFLWQRLHSRLAERKFNLERSGQ